MPLKNVYLCLSDGKLNFGTCGYFPADPADFTETSLRSPRDLREIMRTWLTTRYLTCSGLVPEFTKIRAMNEMLTFGLLCITSFFTLINPLGAMPVFMTMTMDLDKAERKKVARKASLVSFLIMMLFAISGDFLFRFFGISIDSLRIVGGIIFLIMGMDMLQARLVKIKVKESEVRKYVNDISITPLSIPMLCGPGAITNAIVLWNKAVNWEMKIMMVLAVALVISLVYLILRSSTKIIKILGETGNNVMMRLMGLIVMVIAVEFFFSGLKPIVVDILQSVFEK